jgi:preprotein translocase subunit SecY
MLEKLRVVFAIPELRTRILVTLMFLAIYRIGWQIPLPIVDQSAMTAWAQDQQGGLLGQVMNQVALFSASSLNQATIFGLGIMPYISASIIFQLLASVWKPLEELKKEGPSGQKKINEYTRYATVVLCIVQSAAFLYVLAQNQLIRPDLANAAGGLLWHWWFISLLTMTAGTVFLMWVGEQIDEHGIGNGISLLIMAGILADMPGAGLQLINQSTNSLGGSGLGPDKLLLLLVLFLGVVTGVVLITQGQRRIPLNSAKHMRGRRVFGGGRQYLPLRVNQAGVMPIIFASSLLILPGLLLAPLQALFGSPAWLLDLQAAFQPGPGFFYNTLYVAMIFFFCFFWVTIVFNPKDMSEELKRQGAFIPGYRPGKKTEMYLERVMERITYVGAAFLALVAILPTIIAHWAGLDMTVAQFYGGTGLLIAVSVAFDLVQKIDSHLVMRNYRGLLERS